MKIYVKLFIAGAIFFIIGMKIPVAVNFSAFCFTGGFILLIIQGIKEINNKNKAPKNSTDYTSEARRACEDVTPKRKRDEKPPWEI